MSTYGRITEIIQALLVGKVGSGVHLTPDHTDHADKALEEHDGFAYFKITLPLANPVLVHCTYGSPLNDCHVSQIAFA